MGQLKVPPAAFLTFLEPTLLSFEEFHPPVTVYKTVFNGSELLDLSLKTPIPSLSNCLEEWTIKDCWAFEHLVQPWAHGKDGVLAFWSIWGHCKEVRHIGDVFWGPFVGEPLDLAILVHLNPMGWNPLILGDGKQKARASPVPVEDIPLRTGDVGKAGSVVDEASIEDLDLFALLLEDLPLEVVLLLILLVILLGQAILFVDSGNESVSNLHDALLPSPKAKGSGCCPRRDGLCSWGLGVTSFTLPHPCGIRVVAGRRRGRWDKGVGHTLVAIGVVKGAGVILAEVGVLEGVGAVDPCAMPLREVEPEVSKGLVGLELKVGKGEWVSGWALDVGNEGFLGRMGDEL